MVLQITIITSKKSRESRPNEAQETNISVVCGQCVLLSGTTICVKY